ncbi:protein of unknown function [Duganella sp. CF517]|uniref:DUF4124 domain-containing protein n=1 Tax=Duganella sp. CF517 TaxID=1881038 RepID=UPI0008BB4D07|nr:DUF4124 domain-containing protein [Duganella sp. CF517]SEN79663.1 protein of unknown function [Duganella sp. CF517]
MKTSLKLTKMLLCAGVFAATACATSFASAGINRCVDAQGSVLLTDAECPQGSRVANDDAGVSDTGAEGIVINTGVERVVPGMLGGASLPRSRWADLPRPLLRKASGTDAATLQAARSSLQMQDEMRRQSRVASR